MTSFTYMYIVLDKTNKKLYETTNNNKYSVWSRAFKAGLAIIWSELSTTNIKKLLNDVGCCLEPAPGVCSTASWEGVGQRGAARQSRLQVLQGPHHGLHPN